MNSQVDVSANMLSVSTSPYIKTDDSISKIMWNVNIALAPAAIFGIFYFGVPALINIIVAIVAAVGAEYAVQKIRKVKVTAFDGSAFLTGLLLAMSISPQMPYYMTALGTIVAIVVAKHSMGGLGQNIFNPAHIGRAALMVSWPIAMTTWSSITTKADVVTSATPLGILKLHGYSELLKTFGGQSELYKALLLGTRNGSIGETCTVHLALDGLYLIYKKIIN